MNTYGFEKLDVWNKSVELSEEIYLTTKEFPSDEKFGIISQLRRASISVSSNIAEGSSRSSYKEQARFSEIAYGSLVEVLNQIILSYRLSFIKEDSYLEIRKLIEEISNKLNGLRKYQLGKANS
jgi:four helix bundle protein